MGYKIACYTLFDVSNTGVLNRSTPPADMIYDSWTKARNQQCNYDTVLQVIALRGLPEITISPQKIKISKKHHSYFGSEYEFGKNDFCWTFEFYVQDVSVFNNGIQDLGTLFVDSHDVPMIRIGSEHRAISKTLNTSPTLKNIHFIITDHDYTPDT